jgi:histone-lysine N-methyltransferase SETMAR
MMWLLIIYTLLIIKYVSGPKTDPLPESITKQEQWAFIKCHELLGTTATQVYNMLQNIRRSQALGRTQVFQLYKEFNERSRLSSEEVHREDRPRTLTDEFHKEKLKELILEDHNWGTFEYAETLGISYWATRKLLKEIGAKKIATRWVPHQLTPAQKNSRADICTEHLERYKSDHGMLDRIMAIDKTWLKYYDPKDYWASRQYRLPGEPP